MERNCKNCGSLVYAGKAYCSDCGAKWIEKRITLRSVGADFADMYIGLDTRFVRTFVDLFKRPEAVIKGFIDGRRMGYVDAIRYLFISLFLSGIFIFLLKKMDIEMFDPQELRTVYENMGYNEEMINTQISFMSGYTAFVQDYMSFIILLSIPIYAFLGKLTFWGKRYYNYTEQVVVQLYTYSQVAIALAPLNLIVIYFFKDIYFIWSNVPLLTMLLFNAYVYKRLFKLDFSGILVKSLLFILWTVLVFLVIIITGIVLTFLSILIYKKLINPAWDPSSLGLG